MKKLSLINLHKVEIKKNMLAQIKGGIDVRCLCSMNCPQVTLKNSGPSGELCACTDTTTNNASVQTKTSL